MNQTDQDKDRFSPDKLLDGFRKTAFIKWLIIAVLAHAVLIAVTSVSYMLDVVNPDRVERRKAEEKARIEAKQAAFEKPASGQDGGEEAAPASTSAPAMDSDAALLEQHKDSPVVKAITEVAKPEEIPDKPQNIGISFEDTNIR